MKIPWAVQSYRARAVPLSAQRLVNFYAEQAPADAKDQIPVYGSPGIKAFASSLAGKVRGRGMHVMGGVLYAIAGNTLYSIDSAGAATSLGTINTQIGNVSMDHNLAGTQQLAIVDGQDGWIYDTTNGLVQITDTDFFAADIVIFIDQYFAFNRKGTGQWFISNLNDGKTYDATDITNAEGAPDLLISLIANHREVWAFGEETTEVYFNSGAANFPFERNEAAFIERGCAAAASVAEDDNSIFWLGDDLIVYRADGYAPVRISNHAIEEEISKYSTVDDGIAFFITMSGHKWYVLTFPLASATFIFDVATGLWHERSSGLFGQGRWNVSAYIRAYGKHLVGDSTQGRIGELDADVYAEYGNTMQGILTGPTHYADRYRIFFGRFELDVETGQGLTTGQGNDPQIWLDWSNDGGRTWSARKPFRSMGKIGQYRTRVRWLGLGSARQRTFRATLSDPVRRNIVAAHLEADQGLG